ncbi:MAG: helix-turn-helix transcriptional regulator [Ilumatobacteraceae bacterium]
MAEALERVTNLLALLLSARTPITLAEIGNELADYYPPGEVALRGAFERDKKLLRDIGIPIETEVFGGNDAGKTGYRIDRRRYELADLDLADDERAALELAVAAARLSKAEFGLLKLGGARSSSMVMANVPHVECLPVLREATAASAEVTFRYHGSERILQPYVLLLREGFWYVIGRDVGRGEQRTYRADRIEGSVTMGGPGAFTRPTDFDARTAFPADAGLLGDEPDSMATVLVRGRRPGHEHELGSVVEQRPDGSIVVEVPCANRDAFRSWLFGWGTDAEVLGPPDVRADVVAWLQAMAGQR